MNNDTVEITKGLECGRFELVTSQGTYILQLDNETIKMADRQNILGKLTEMGTQERLENLIWIFGLKEDKFMNLNLARKIVETLTKDRTYNLIDLQTTLVNELSSSFEKVFLFEGTKTLKKI